jgi:hypothetical protein
MDKWYSALGKTIMFTGSFIFIKPLFIATAYFTGWIVSLICGDMLAEGLNLIFNTTRFYAYHIPMISAVLGMFASYLRTSVTVEAKKEN